MPSEAAYGFRCRECHCAVDEALRGDHFPGCSLDPGERWADLDHQDTARMLEKNATTRGIPDYKSDDAPVALTAAELEPLNGMSELPDLKLPDNVRADLQQQLGK